MSFDSSLTRSDRKGERVSIAHHIRGFTTARKGSITQTVNTKSRRCTDTWRSAGQQVSRWSLQQLAPGLGSHSGFFSFKYKFVTSPFAKDLRGNERYNELTGFPCPMAVGVDHYSWKTFSILRHIRPWYCQKCITTPMLPISDIIAYQNLEHRTVPKGLRTQSILKDNFDRNSVLQVYICNSLRAPLG